MFELFGAMSDFSFDRYAGNIAPQILKYFEYFTQIDYPLPKVDIAAIPDFAAGMYSVYWIKIPLRYDYLVRFQYRCDGKLGAHKFQVDEHQVIFHNSIGNLLLFEILNPTY